MESVVEEYLMKKYEGVLLRIVRVKKEDLKMASIHEVMLSALILTFCH